MPDVPICLMKEHSTPASTCQLTLLASWWALALGARHFSPECSKRSLSRSGWHHCTVICTYKKWELVVQRWGYQKEWVHSSQASVLSSTDSQGMLLGWWFSSGKAREMPSVPAYSFGLILIYTAFLLAILLTIIIAFLVLHLFYCWITDCWNNIVYTVNHLIL